MFNSYSFGNTMIWGAPSWSDAAPQFTHGFPRKLCDKTSHGGFKKGNIAICSKATNLAIRRFGVDDVLASTCTQTVQGLGLGLAALLSLR